MSSAQLKRVSGQALQHRGEGVVVGHGDVARGFADVDALGRPSRTSMAERPLADTAVQFERVP